MMRRTLLFAFFLFALFALPPARLPEAHASSGQVGEIPFVVRGNPSNSATSYRSPDVGGNINWATTEGTEEAVFGGDGTWTLSNWTVNLIVAPGAGTQYVFTVRKNEADTALTVTISGTAKTATDSTHSATFSPGDRISVSSVPTSTPAAPTFIAWVWKYTAPSANEFPLLSGTTTGNTVAANSQKYFPVIGFTYGTTEGGFGSAGAVVWPTGGTFKDLYVDMDTDVGNTHTIAVTLRQNGSDTGLTVTVTGNGTTSKTGNDTSHSVTVAAGDRLAWSVLSNAGSTSTRPRIGALFAPTTGSESVMAGVISIAQATTQFCWQSASNNTTETNIQCPVLACTLKSLYLDAQGAAPANGQTLTYTLNKTAATTGITCSFQGTGTASDAHANDTTHTATTVDADLVDLKVVTSSTTGNVAARYAWVMDVTQPAGALGSRGGGSGLSGLSGQVTYRPIPKARLEWN